MTSSDPTAARSGSDTSEPEPRSPDDTATAAVGTSADGALPSGPAGPMAEVGGHVGRYVVLEEVGRGGMGRVLRAYDPKLQREVALKEVRGEGLSIEGSQRLVEEARAMAKLSHPNVVSVFDVENIDGRIVLSMEYVAGTTLRAWLRAQTRPWREIVARFVAAGEGVAAAHAAGLLHRDFKPANVLVREEGDVVKVTDFGLAKATTSSLEVDPGRSEASTDSLEGLTVAGTVLGTPRYMAPEQHRGEPLTGAADQYALGVAVWEALAGAPPFSASSAAELLRSKEAGAPAGTLDVPRPIADALRRALAPRPADRWPDMTALLSALRDDPARRRRRAGGVVGAVALVGLGGAGWWTLSQSVAERCAGGPEQLAGIWDEARRAAAHDAIVGPGTSYAEATWQRSAASVDAYAQAWTAMHREVCEATTVRGEQSAEVMDLRMACLHRARVELAAVTGVLATADADVLLKAHEVIEDLRPLERCADVAALQADVEPPLPKEAEAVEAVRVDLARAEAERLAGRYELAQTHLDAATQRLDDDGVEYGPVRTEVALQTGRLHHSRGRYAESEAALGDAMRLAVHWDQRDALRDAVLLRMYVVGGEQKRFAEALQLRELAEGLSEGEPRAEATLTDHLAVVLEAQGKYDEAEAAHRSVLSLRLETLGDDHPNVAQSHNNLGSVLEAQGKYEEAEAEARVALASWQRTLGPDSPYVAGAHNNLGNMLYKQGRYEAAEQEHREALALRLKSLGADHPEVAASRGNLANALRAQGKLEEAEREQRAALALREKTLGPDHPEVADSRTSLANVLLAQHEYAAAEQEHRAALAMRQEALGPDHPDVAASRNNLAAVLMPQGKYAEAEAEDRAALELLLRTLGDQHPYVAQSRNNLAAVLSAQGKYAEAEAEYRAALSMWRETLDPDHPYVAATLLNLGSTLMKQHELEAALPFLEDAWAIHQRAPLPDGQAAQTAFVLAKALWSGARDRARARSLAQQAAALYRRAQSPNPADVADVERWLREHGSGH